MSEHPIEGLMKSAMNSIKDMIDVNTIIGEPIKASETVTIIPVSKVCFGFAAGGTEFRGETLDEYTKKEKEEQAQYRLPFGGGSGAAVTIHPVAFMVINETTIKLLPAYNESSIDKIINYVPEMLEKANDFIKRDKEKTKEEKDIGE